MTQFFANLLDVLSKTSPYWGLFLGTFALGYVLTPLCRELARKCGMVDAPSARRINKVPTPRAGGLAVFLSVTVALAVYMSATGARLSPLFPNEVIWRVMGLSAALVVVGLADDKFGLPPVVKLAGQVAVALGAFFWCHAGFHTVPIFAEMPAWLDCILTTFWIVGAINAFNLIDGMDGLATGLALIAAIGMGGSLVFIGYPQATLVYLAFAGACLAFLRYNFNPASVFLGDTGSMYIGFLLSVLPLVMKSGDSLFVSLGVPLLAMGVPIFDTTLAILRRSIRAVLSREQYSREEGSTHVMQADTDHLHHRILRRFVSQRKAAFALYALAAFFVAVGFGALALRDRAAGLFIVAFVVGVVIVVRDMRRIELWDAGRLLNAFAHDRTSAVRRRRAMLAVPFYVMTDALMLVAMWFLTMLELSLPVTDAACHTYLPLSVVPVFFALVFFHAYSTVWSRARISNYVRLAIAPASWRATRSSSSWATRTATWSPSRRSTRRTPSSCSSDSASRARSFATSSTRSTARASRTIPRRAASSCTAPACATPLSAASSCAAPPATAASSWACSTTTSSCADTTSAASGCSARCRPRRSRSAPCGPTPS